MPVARLQIAFGGKHQYSAPSRLLSVRRVVQKLIVAVMVSEYEPALTS
jgi:hypothetical protein